MKLKILNDLYQVIKLNPTDSLPDNFTNEEFYSFTKTDEEISIVTNSNIEIKSEYSEKDWKIIKIEGKLDFGMIGILAKISNILAENKISIFVLSTYDTDYILVKEEKLMEAKRVLILNNYLFD